MTLPNPAREHHGTLKVLEQLGALEQRVEQIAATGPVAIPASTDVTWFTRSPDDPDALVAHRAVDDGSGLLRVPVGLSFALRSPLDPDAIICPLIEEA